MTLTSHQEQSGLSSQKKGEEYEHFRVDRIAIFVRLAVGLACARRLDEFSEHVSAEPE